MSRKLGAWNEKTVEAIRQFPALLKSAIAICVTMGPWAYAVSGSGGLGVLAFGLSLGFCYAYLSGWETGAIFGIVTVIFLGPVTAIVSPFVTSLTSFWFFAAVSGFSFSMLFGLGNALADLKGRPGADIFSGDAETSKTLLALQFVVVPVLAVSVMLYSLSKPLQTEENLFAGVTLFLAANCLTLFALILLNPNLRPAMLFYEQIKPLLRAMWAGLASFALGYGFTILVFAGFYMALYRLDPKFFQLQILPNPQLWDFIYFSVTTMTTIGLSDLKPASDRVWPQAIVSAELIVGIFWIVVYFAVAMTLLQVHAKTILESLAPPASPKTPAT